MKLKFLFAVSFIIYYNTFTQSWTLQKLPTYNLFEDISFFSQNKAVIVGLYGLILTTTDGGITWNKKNINTDENLYSVSFSDTISGIAVGNQTILRTTDAGETWIQLEMDIKEEFLNSVFTSVYKGFIVGEKGTILLTTNAGLTWEKINSGTDRRLCGISFFDEQNGVISGGNGIILKTTNGGLSWIKLREESANYTFYSHVYYNSSGKIIATNATGSISISTDGGVSWTIKKLSLSLFGDIHFFDDNNGFISCIYEQYLYTTDGGQTWNKKQIVDHSEYFTGISFLDSEKGFIISQGGRVFKTTDSGNSWSRLTIGRISDLRGVSATDSDNCTIVGEYGAIFRTTDGGNSWNFQNSGSILAFNAVKFIDKMNGFIVANQNGVVLKTSNAGLTWESVNIPRSNELFDIHIFDKDNVIVTGSKIFKTSDGGINWIISYLPEVYTSFTKIDFVNKNLGFAIGYEGTVLKSTDGGTTWIKLQYDIGSHLLNDVSFADENNGLIVTYSGLVYRTTDGGITWEEQNIIYYMSLNAVEFINLSNAYIISDSGTIYHSNDGGLTWVLQPSGLDGLSDLVDVSFADEKNGFIVGWSGVVINTKTGGFTYIDSNDGVKIPTDFDVFQNYPNPFNPCTEISFSLSFRSHVSISVFDILGKEVESLLDKEMEAGFHTLQWKPENISSGVYFCCFKKGSSLKFLKMVYVK